MMSIDGSCSEELLKTQCVVVILNLSACSIIKLNGSKSLHFIR